MNSASDVILVEAQLFAHAHAAVYIARTSQFNFNLIRHVSLQGLSLVTSYFERSPSSPLARQA